MDLATLIGIIGGLAVVVSAIIVGGSAGMFIDVASILIVIFGSMFVVAVKFNLSMLPNAIKVALLAFMFKLEKPSELIEKAEELAAAAKKGGPLALEKIKCDNYFMQKGVDMLVDGYDPEVIGDILSKEKNLMLERHEMGQKFFEALADVAPAMGMIGTLIGLVQMLANMADPASIGPAMAVALLTTLYGAVLANMIAKPIADKLGLRAKEEELNQALVIDAVLGIQAGLNPRIVKDSLQNYLPKRSRVGDDPKAA